jgi:hypothetical protein
LRRFCSQNAGAGVVSLCGISIVAKVRRTSRLD